MAKQENITLEGVVTHCGAGGVFRVKCDGDHEIIASLAGKMRKNRIRVVLGDQVSVAVSPYDPTRGLIVFRSR